MQRSRRAPVEAQPIEGQPEPWRVKVIEPIRRTSREERERLLKEAEFNLFALRAEDVFVDLLTDSGLAAMSASQWAGAMLGDESYAGARSFYRLQASVSQTMGFPHVIPAHQGRGAEHVLAAALLRPGHVVPSNALFDTTRAHVEHAGAKGLDLLHDHAYDPAHDHPFKGNLHTGRLKKLLETSDPGQVPLIVVTATCNMTGGQPVSMENMAEVARLAHEFDVPLAVDAARFAENAYFIKRREHGFRDRPVASIALEFLAYADIVSMSAKKDALANIGGFLAMRDRALYEKCLPFALLFEGYPTYGGLAGRDLEIVARGLKEGVDDAYLEARVGQVEGFHQTLVRAGVPVLRPAGGHAVYVDAAKFLPHVPWDAFPGHALACALYLEAGVRGVEVGSLMAGRDPATGENRRSRMELLRLAVPRRMYTDNHLRFAAEALIRLYGERHEIGGVRFTREAPVLRHFSSAFAQLEAEQLAVRGERAR